MDTPNDEDQEVVRMTNVSPAHHDAPLPPGTVAPDFELPSTPDQKVMLSHFRGRSVFLVFYPEDRSPVCSDQLGPCSRSSRSTTRSCSRSRSTAPGATWRSPKTATCTSHCCPTSSPKEREVSRAYHGYRSQEGTRARALFMLDADGIIRWSYLSPVAVNPGADGILRALEQAAAGRP